MRRLRAAVLAALSAALPILASGLHGWFLAGLAVTAGFIASLALTSKKMPPMLRSELGLIRNEY